jgi:methionyl-tRNA synthetase
MRVVGAANKYISESEPWKLKSDPERQGTVLNTALQVVSDANTLLTPFLPHAAQQVYAMLGGQGVWAPQPEIRQVKEDGVAYPVLTGDYASASAVWQSRPVQVGAPLAKPVPLFAKLPEELATTGPDWAPIAR